MENTWKIIHCRLLPVKFYVKFEVKLKQKAGHHQYRPGDSADLEVDMGNQEDATVALLIVDKAIYALGTQNKLTSKQVWSKISLKKRSIQNNLDL